MHALGKTASSQSIVPVSISSPPNVVLCNFRRCPPFLELRHLILQLHSPLFYQRPMGSTAEVPLVGTSAISPTSALAETGVSASTLVASLSSSSALAQIEDILSGLFEPSAFAVS